MMTSAAERPSSLWVSTGMPRPSSLDGDRVVARGSVTSTMVRRGVAGLCLVDRVVDQLEHHVVEARGVVGVADVHPRALAHRLETLQDLDALGGVASSTDVLESKDLLLRSGSPRNGILPDRPSAVSGPRAPQNGWVSRRFPGKREADSGRGASERRRMPGWSPMPLRAAQRIADGSCLNEPHTILSRGTDSKLQELSPLFSVGGQGRSPQGPITGATSTNISRHRPGAVRRAVQDLPDGSS